MCLQRKIKQLVSERVYLNLNFDLLKYIKFPKIVPFKIPHLTLPFDLLYHFLSCFLTMDFNAETPAEDIHLNTERHCVETNFPYREILRCLRIKTRRWNFLRRNPE